jgi:hypothetical protein
MEEAVLASVIYLLKIVSVANMVIISYKNIFSTISGDRN